MNISKYTVPVNGSDITYNIRDNSGAAERLSNLAGYVGYQSEHILGLQADFENSTFTRLSAAKGKTAGADFDAYNMFGGRKLCNLADDGTVNSWYGDASYTEDGSNGQVMVYQPKFYYKTVPMKLEYIGKGMGYHIRKANYYISDYPMTGFKVHPAFLDANGQELAGIFLSAYEGSIYDVSEAKYLVYDDMSDDGEFTPSTYMMDTTVDKFSSVAGVKPASGNKNVLTRPAIETMCKNRGTGWHNLNLQVASMEQLLMAIEYGGFNTQSLLGSGVTAYTSGSGNEASQTGSTASLGNSSGVAQSTIHYASDGTRTVDTAAGKLSVKYRGVENDYGNIWKNVDGLNIWGDGTLHGGVAYYCTDFNYAESKKTDNYADTGIAVSNVQSYVSAFGYSDACDWAFLPSEAVGANSSKPVGDMCYVTQNVNGWRITRLGGSWSSSAYAGGFCWALDSGVGYRTRYIGGRLLYIPTT